MRFLLSRPRGLFKGGLFVALFGLKSPAWCPRTFVRFRNSRSAQLCGVQVPLQLDETWKNTERPLTEWGLGIRR